MSLEMKYFILTLLALGALSCRPQAPIFLSTQAHEDTYDLFVRLATDFPPTTDSTLVVLDHPIAHEGLHTLGERALLSYQENMPRLIDTLRHRGYRVALVLNRPAPDFNEVDLQDMAAVNALMPHWAPIYTPNE